MDGQAFELLMDKMNQMENRIIQMDRKLEEIMEFKWQIIGGSVAISAILSVALTVILKG
jgi:hypothetical protein